MTGLEKIVNRILEDAAQESKEILDQAEETKEDILTEFRRKVPENLREKQKITESAQPPLQI